VSPASRKSVLFLSIAVLTCHARGSMRTCDRCHDRDGPHLVLEQGQARPVRDGHPCGPCRRRQPTLATKGLRALQSDLLHGSDHPGRRANGRLRLRTRGTAGDARGVRGPGSPGLHASTPRQTGVQVDPESIQDAPWIPRPHPRGKYSPKYPTCPDQDGKTPYFTGCGGSVLTVGLATVTAFGRSDDRPRSSACGPSRRPADRASDSRAECCWQASRPGDSPCGAWAGTRGAWAPAGAVGRKRQDRAIRRRARGPGGRSTHSTGTSRRRPHGRRDRSPRTRRPHSHPERPWRVPIGYRAGERQRTDPRGDPRPWVDLPDARLRDAGEVGHRARHP
jgi:hypothetical protein